MGSVNRSLLPDPVDYYTNVARVHLSAKGKWRTCRCFNCDRNAMRVETVSGGFVCMAACGAKGGDVLSYHMALNGLSFVDAAKDLGVYADDGKPCIGPVRPAQPTGRALLQLAADDLYRCASVLSTVRAVLLEYPGLKVAMEGRLTGSDIDDYMQAAGRVIYLAGVAKNA